MAPEAGHDGGEANQNTVFIDTSLDTHLATIVSDSDTVFDLKRKIMAEHQQCFPAIGNIKIHCLKVKRRGNFYHLSDSLLVKSAFGATKRNWFLSVDASCLEQHGESQRFGKPNAGDQLALPWVTDSRSIDGHDSHADRPSKLSLVHGLPSMHKIVSFVNQRVPSVDQFASGDSCKDVSKNMEEDRSSNDNRWRNTKSYTEKLSDPRVHEKRDVDKEIKSKKRIRDVHNKGSLEDALESGPSVKKKRKTEKVEGNVKASEGDGVLTYDTNKVKCKAVNVNDENSVEHKSKGQNVTLDDVVTEPLSDRHTRTMSISRKKKINRINKGKDNSAPDQLATVVPPNVADGKETLSQKNTEASQIMADVAVVLEKNIQQEIPFGISQKEKGSEFVQKAVIGSEIPSSSIRTSDHERDAPGVTSVGHLKGSKHSTKHNAAEKEVSSTPFIKKLHDINKDTVDSSQQDLGSTGQKLAGDWIDKSEEDREFSLNQGPEVKLPEKRKETMGCENPGGSKRRKAKKSAAKNKDESLVKHADNFVGDISSVVPTPVFDDEIIDERKNDKVSLSHAERNEVPEKKIIDDSLVYTGKKGHDLIVEKVEILQPTESNRSQVRAEDVEEKSSKELKDTVGSKRKKKKVGRSASRYNDSVVKHANNAATGTNEENLLPRSEWKEGLEMTSIDVLHVDRDRSDDHPMDNDVEIARTEKNRNQVNAVDINDESKKENEKMDGTKKSKKKKKTKKSAARNEDESIMKHANGDVCSMSPAVPDPGLDGLLHENAKEGKSCLPDADRKDVPKEKLADASQVGVGTDGKVRGKDAEFLPVSETNRNEDGEDGKSRNKRSSTSQSLSLVPIEEQGNGVGLLQLNELDKAQDSQVRKAKKNHKSSARDYSDLPSKHQAAELELEPEKCKAIEHHPLPEETSKHVVVSEVSKVRMGGRDDVDILKDRSHEIDFMHYFVPGQQQNENASIDNVKDATKSGREKKTKELLPLVETSPGLGNSLVSCDNQQNRGQDDSRNDSGIQSQKALSKNENNKVLLSFKKTSEASTDGAKDPNIPNIDQIKTPKKTKKIDAPRTSKSAPANKGNARPSAESSSSSETSGRSFHNQVSNKRQSSLGQTRVSTSKKTTPVLNSSQHVKSSLNTRGAIFGDSSDESSADDNAIVDSDASSRTPSGKSSSSGESDSSVDSRRNGSHATKRKEGSGKNIINSQSRLKNISMADILRSSSRFKKAKLTASQQIEDTESQPVDFVPESQPTSKR